MKIGLENIKFDTIICESDPIAINCGFSYLISSSCYLLSSMNDALDYLDKYKKSINHKNLEFVKIIL